MWLWKRDLKVLLIVILADTQGDGVKTANRVAFVCTTHGKALLKARFCRIRPTRLPANTTTTNADLRRD